MKMHDYHYQFFCIRREAEKYLDAQKQQGYVGYVEHYREKMWQVITYRTSPR